MKAIWAKIAPGIRFKLTVFTLFFVSALLVFSFIFSYFRQKEELSSSFEREMHAPLEFVSSHVGELHKISGGLIQLENFRIRLRQKAAEAKRFQIVGRGDKEKTAGNFFRGVAGAFGARVNYTYQTRRFDTYYSTYLTDKNLKDFEAMLKSFVDMTMNGAATAADFTRWKTLAAQIAATEIRIAALENPPEWLKQNTTKLRARLLGDLRRPFGPLFSARLERTGFRPESIRILSYDAEQAELLDTAVFFPQSGTATQKLFRNAEFGKFRNNFFGDEKLLFARSEFNVQQTPFDAQFSPVFVNIPVVERARRIAEMGKKPGFVLEEFIEADKKAIAELKGFAQIKAERIKILREKGVPPFRDPEFMAAAKDYRAVAEKRDAALAAVLQFAQKEKEQAQAIQGLVQAQQEKIAAATKKIRELEDLLKKVEQKKAPKDAPSAEELQGKIEGERQIIEAAESEKFSLKARESSIAEHPDLVLAEALLHLRNAALYAKIRLSLISEQDVLTQELRSAAARKDQLRNFATIRQFIYDANNETQMAVPRGAKSPLAGGVLAVTRTEAEEYMHLLDTTPLIGQGDTLAKQLLSENVVGFNLAIINKADELKRILASTRWLIIFSSGIAVLAIFAAWYFSGFAVRRIASLSSTSALVRDGNLQVDFDGRGYDELASLGQSLNSMVAGLKEREELKGELMAAEEIQKRLLPADKPKNLAGKADIAGFYKAMVGVGGDYFDYIGLGNDYVAIAMGDVSSHGVGPALVMAMTRAQLHAQLREKEISLKEIMLKLNEQLYAETPAHMFVTFFLGLYNLKTGELQYISAGHSKPLMYHNSNGKTEYVEAGGMPLGMDENDFFATTIELRKVTLAKGDIFLQYTDGLSEAMNPAREQFGYERMESVLKGAANETPEAILAALAKSVEAFAETRLDQPGPSALSDDIALVCLKRG
ncbi:MAG: SpoIIE family protein phosphatase [Turneriella sp.]|nr:SpoIIE family protein phosphatase [Turneriella sp.]